MGWAQWVLYVYKCRAVTRGLQCLPTSVPAHETIVTEQCLRTETLTWDTVLDALYTSTKIVRPGRIKDKKTVRQTQTFEV